VARGDEQLRQLIEATSQDYLLCICSSGRVCQIATHRIAVATRAGKGEPLGDLLELHRGEQVVMVVPVEAYDEDRYLVTFSRLGKVKKTPLSEYRSADTDGFQDMKLADGDEVVTALISQGRGEYFVTTDSGQTLRFSDEQLRAQGRSGQGVAAMTLGKGALVVSANYLDSEQDGSTFANMTTLLVVTENGLAKKVPLSQYPQKGRATAGVVTIDVQNKDRVLLTMLVHEADMLLVTWVSGKSDQATVVKAADIKSFTRAHKGEAIVQGTVTGVVQL
jgi:DNA gyrase subunit A